jgi:hypothetical protein
VPAGTAVPRGQVQPERADLPEERALVDPQRPGGGEAVEAVPLEGLPDETGFRRVRLVTLGAGEGPRRVSEEVRLEQRLGQRAAS